MRVAGRVDLPLGPCSWRCSTHDACSQGVALCAAQKEPTVKWACRGPSGKGICGKKCMPARPSSCFFAFSQSGPGSKLPLLPFRYLFRFLEASQALDHRCSSRTRALSGPAARAATISLGRSGFEDHSSRAGELWQLCDPSLAHCRAAASRETHPRAHARRRPAPCRCQPHTAPRAHPAPVAAMSASAPGQAAPRRN